jgi:hypothetical protein
MNLWSYQVFLKIIPVSITKILYRPTLVCLGTPKHCIVCICICVCVCVYVCMYMCVCMCVCMHVCMYVCVCMYVHACRHACTNYVTVIIRVPPTVPSLRIPEANTCLPGAVIKQAQQQLFLYFYLLMPFFYLHLVPTSQPSIAHSKPLCPFHLHWTMQVLGVWYCPFWRGESAISLSRRLFYFASINHLYHAIQFIGNLTNQHIFGNN